MKRHLLPIAFAALTALSAHAQTNVTPHLTGITANGATYYLPKTAMRFVVNATRTTHHAGPYAQYAERYLGITDAVSADVDTWTLDAIQAVTYSLPDASQAYSIQFNPKTSAPLVTLTADGILLAINDEGDYSYVLPESSVHDLTVVNPDPTNFYSEDFLRAGSMHKKAEILAEEIYDIREKRSMIANGEADFNPTDGTQLRLMLERQDAREEALKSLFVGHISKKAYTYVIDFIPSTTVSDKLLFRFSSRLGMVDADDLAGEPYYVSLIDETDHAPVAEPDPNAKKKAKKADKLEADVRYRVPGRGRIIVRDTKEKVYEATLHVAQFGEIQHLRGTLFDKKFTTKVQFNPLTGNIRHIDIIQ